MLIPDLPAHLSYRVVGGLCTILAALYMSYSICLRHYLALFIIIVSLLASEGETPSYLAVIQTTAVKYTILIDEAGLCANRVRWVNRVKPNGFVTQKSYNCRRNLCVEEEEMRIKADLSLPPLEYLGQ